MFSLTGAHGTGKTTLARKVAERLHIPFIETKTSDVFEQLGRDPKEDLPFNERLAVQEVILRKLREQYLSLDTHVPWITDRCPLDVLAYTISEIGRNDCPNDLLPALQQHILRCYEILNMFFTHVWHLQPGVRPQERLGKAPANIAHIEHFNMLIPSLAAQPFVTCAVLTIPREIVELNLRVELVTNQILSTLIDTNERKLAA